MKNLKRVVLGLAVVALVFAGTSMARADHYRPPRHRGYPSHHRSYCPPPRYDHHAYRYRTPYYGRSPYYGSAYRYTPRYGGSQFGVYGRNFSFQFGF